MSLSIVSAFEKDSTESSLGVLIRVCMYVQAMRIVLLAAKCEEVHISDRIYQERMCLSKKWCKEKGLTVHIDRVPLTLLMYMESRTMNVLV